jgi:hypothetical protein
MPRPIVHASACVDGCEKTGSIPRKTAAHGPNKLVDSSVALGNHWPLFLHKSFVDIDRLPGRISKTELLAPP